MCLQIVEIASVNNFNRFYSNCLYKTSKKINVWKCQIWHIVYTTFGTEYACTYPLRTNSQELIPSEYLQKVDKMNGKIRRINLNGHAKSLIERPRENVRKGL